MMKSPFFLSLLAFFLLSCGPDKQHARIEGELSNIRQAEFYVYSEDGAFVGIDTIRIQDGTFHYERKLDAPTLLTLLYPNFTSTRLIAEPGKTVRMRGDAARLSAAEVVGTKENELLTDFRLANLNQNERRVRLAAQQFIRDHAATLAAFSLFKQYFGEQARVPASESLQLLDVLRKARPDDPLLKSYEARMRPLLLCKTGEKLPDFSARDIEGEPRQLSDYAGRPLLVIACASWQYQSVRLVKTAARLNRKYKDRLGVLALSLDFSEDYVRKRLKADTLAFPTLCDYQSFESPLVRIFAIERVPSNILVDSKGRIVARDVKESDLEKEIEKLM